MTHATGSPAYQTGCYWTGYLNNFDGEVSLTLGSSQVLRGINSYHR